MTAQSDNTTTTTCATLAEEAVTHTTHNAKGEASLTVDTHTTTGALTSCATTNSAQVEGTQGQRDTFTVAQASVTLAPPPVCAVRDDGDSEEEDNYVVIVSTAPVQFCTPFGKGITKKPADMNFTTPTTPACFTTTPCTPPSVEPNPLQWPCMAQALPAVNTCAPAQPVEGKNTTGAAADTTPGPAAFTTSTDECTSTPTRSVFTPVTDFEDPAAATDSLCDVFPPRLSLSESRRASCSSLSMHESCEVEDSRWDESEMERKTKGFGKKLKTSASAWRSTKTK